jgi:hypothetical protein
VSKHGVAVGRDAEEDFTQGAYLNGDHSASHLRGFLFARADPGAPAAGVRSARRVAPVRGVTTLRDSLFLVAPAYRI